MAPGDGIHTIIYIRMKMNWRMHTRGAAIAVGAALALCCGDALAVDPGNVRWHNESADTTRITDILIAHAVRPLPAAGEILAGVAAEFTGTPYGAGTLDIAPEAVTVNLDSTDCMAFVENAAALTMTLLERRGSWIDFVYNLERLRYRNGTAGDYASRLHYFSDWVVDNSHKGIVTEVTDRVGNASSAVKTLDYMTRNRSLYPALADSAAFARMTNAQMGYRNHKFSYLKPAAAARAAIRTGDILAFTTKTPGLDVSHVGIAVVRDGKVYLLHASSKAGKVVLSDVPLEAYLKRNHGISGVRVVRMKD